MLITSQTKYSEIADAEKYITPQSAEEMKRAAEDYFIGMYDLTFADFHACSNGDFSGVLGDMTDPTVLQVFWCKRFADFVQEFSEALKQTETLPTAEEKRAEKGLLKTDWAEGLLVFLQDYFGLRSFKEAETITTGEILIAKRARYNEGTFRRNLAKIYMQKIPKK